MPPSTREFAIRLSSIDQLFWEFDARPVAERTLAADVRWSLVDEWERLRNAEPSHLTIYAPESDRASTDEGAVRGRDPDEPPQGLRPATSDRSPVRQEKGAASIGIAVLLIRVMVSTAMSESSSNVVVEGLSQGILLVGWVALWPAGRALGSRGGAARLRSAALRRVRRSTCASSGTERLGARGAVAALQAARRYSCTSRVSLERTYRATAIRKPCVRRASGFLAACARSAIRALAAASPPIWRARPPGRRSPRPAAAAGVCHPLLVTG